MKNYEMTNHLGNVQATVLDKYTPRIKNPSDTAYTLWGSNISTATDYYAFGSPMPGRATQDTVTQSFVATTPFSTTSTIVIDSVEGNTSHFAWTAFGPTTNLNFVTTPTTQVKYNLGCPANPVSFMNPYGVRLQVNNLQPNKSYKLYVKYKASFAETFSLEQITPNPPFAPIVLQSNASNSSKAVLYLPFTTNATASPVNFHLVYHAQCNYVTIDSVMLVSDTTVVGYVTNVLSEKSGRDDYRHGFNGKEKDNEVKGFGIQYDYGFRIYDSDLGKFLSVDPLTKSYPWYTPYQFAGNKPIRFIDLDGAEECDPMEYLDPVNIWNNAVDGLGNIGLIVGEWMVSDEIESGAIRGTLGKMGYQVDPSISNEDLGRNFSVRKIDRTFTVVTDQGIKGDLINVTISALDVASVIPSKGSVSIMCAKTFIAPVTIASILKGLKISSRTKELMGEVDNAIGGFARKFESEGGAILEESFGQLVRTSKGQAGDFYFLSGKYFMKTVDHIGVPLQAMRSFKMNEFLSSVTAHFRKSVDFIALDMRNFSSAQKKEVMDYIQKNHAKEINRLIQIQ